MAGSLETLTRAFALIGQLYMNGHRLPAIDFLHAPNEVERRGFISSSYSTGLNPREYFFAAMQANEVQLERKQRGANLSAFGRSAHV